MIMNAYLNLTCIGIIKKYPEQWKKSILHMPRTIINIICVLAAICSGIVCYNLFVGLFQSEMVIMVVIIAVCVGASLFCLKTGAAKIEGLEANKRAIIEEALQAE